MKVQTKRMLSILRTNLCINVSANKTVYLLLYTPGLNAVKKDANRLLAQREKCTKKEEPPCWQKTSVNKLCHHSAACIVSQFELTPK